MTPEEKQRCIEIKLCFDLENLHFYTSRNKRQVPIEFHCKYISDPYDFIFEDEAELSFMMKSLSAQQCKIYFDDTQDFCFGLDQLKEKYLIFKLAQLV